MKPNPFFATVEERVLFFWTPTMLKSLIIAVAVCVAAPIETAQPASDTVQRIDAQERSRIDGILDEIERKMNEEHEKSLREKAQREREAANKERSKRIVRLQDHPHFKGWTEKRRAIGIPDGCNKKGRCENGDRWH